MFHVTHRSRAKNCAKKHELCISYISAFANNFLNLVNNESRNTLQRTQMNGSIVRSATRSGIFLTSLVSSTKVARPVTFSTFHKYHSTLRRNDVIHYHYHGSCFFLSHYRWTKYRYLQSEWQFISYLQLREGCLEYSQSFSFLLLSRS